METACKRSLWINSRTAYKLSMGAANSTTEQRYQAPSIGFRSTWSDKNPSAPSRVPTTQARAPSGSASSTHKEHCIVQKYAGHVINSDRATYHLLSPSAAVLESCCGFVQSMMAQRRSKPPSLMYPADPSPLVDNPHTQPAPSPSISCTSWSRSIS